jgi:hypothetical protein
VLTFVGVLVAQRIARVGAVELETRSRREETMRSLRWAAELAVSDHVDQARLGLAQLRALDRSNLLTSDQQGFVDAALRAVVKKAAMDIEHSKGAGRVIPVVDDHLTITDRVTTDLSSIEQLADGEGGEE